MTVVINTPIRPSSDWGTHEIPADTLVELHSNQLFLDSVAGSSARYLHTSRGKLHAVNMPYTHNDTTRNSAAFKVETVSLVVQAMHQAYAAHVPFSMRPETFWYMIVHEVAEHVRQNYSKYASLFTTTPDAKQIVINGGPGSLASLDHWCGMAGQIRPVLEQHAGLRDGAMDLFLPKFTTSTIEDETALLVAFMDVVSPYFGMEWRILCGIPQIRLEGDASDWHMLYEHANGLASKFSGLSGYFTGLLPVLQKIAETSDGTTPDEDFWRSIYQYDGGCGEPTIGGWITAFFAHMLLSDGPYLRQSFNWGDWRSQFYTDAFPSHIGKVPVTFAGSGIPEPIPGVFVAGVTGVDYDETFLSPRLGFVVAQV